MNKARLFSAALGLAISTTAFANPLDLTTKVASVECVGKTAKLSYDGSSKQVLLTTDKGAQSFKLVSLKKAVMGATLIGRSENAGYLVLNLAQNGGTSTVQANATYYYVKCEVK